MKTAIEETYVLMSSHAYKDDDDQLPTKSPNVIKVTSLHVINKPANIKWDNELTCIAKDQGNSAPDEDAHLFSHVNHKLLCRVNHLLSLLFFFSGILFVCFSE